MAQSSMGQDDGTCVFSVFRAQRIRTAARDEQVLGG